MLTTRTWQIRRVAVLLGHDAQYRWCGDGDHEEKGITGLIMASNY